ncbi:MAG TPA: UTP--glucose-1-phosphate uridylyltransferase [bacterium]|nr:UTP--glucose-1-phosphate uridylyltransferase [bacterium]
MKGVILAAGYGTRFLPASKTIPKEMFPLIDTPAIDLIVKEMTDAGIEDILIVTSRRKKPLEDYFDREIELEVSFTDEGVIEKLKLIEPVDVNLFFLRQKRMAGTGDALALVKPFVGDSPFVVAYPDDVQLSGPSLTGQLIELHERTGCTVLAGQEVPTGDISRYGVIASHQQDAVEYVTGMVEKPAPGQEPSRLIGLGRYLYTAELFHALQQTRSRAPKSREFTQTDAINDLASRQRVVVQRIQGRLVDVGTRQGYLHAIIQYGLLRPEFRDGLLRFMQETLRQELLEA